MVAKLMIHLRQGVISETPLSRVRSTMRGTVEEFAHPEDLFTGYLSIEDRTRTDGIVHVSV